MSMAKAVIASPAAVEGIEISNPADLKVADSAEEYASQAVDYLSRARPAVAGESRQWVAERYSWENNLAGIGGMLEPVDSTGRLHAGSGPQSPALRENIA
jgi:hypothetical protein